MRGAGAWQLEVPVREVAASVQAPEQFRENPSQGAEPKSANRRLMQERQVLACRD